MSTEEALELIKDDRQYHHADVTELVGQRLYKTILGTTSERILQVNKTCDNSSSISKSCICIDKDKGYKGLTAFLDRF